MKYPLQTILVCTVLAYYCILQPHCRLHSYKQTGFGFKPTLRIRVVSLAPGITLV